MTQGKIIEIDMVSDIVCPWCWVGLRNLMWAINSMEDQKFSLTFRPFFLDGNLPEEGVEYHAYMDRKFPDKAQRMAGLTALKTAGNNVGVDFQFEKINHRPHTGKAHRLLLWAQGQDRGLLAQESLFHSFFTDGKDIGDNKVLVEIASSIGMDAGLVTELLDNGQDKEKIEAEVEAFRQMGISGVPTFIVDRKAGISGALPPDDLVKFIQQNKNP
ncbi:2-hydroxychromene-2-carboxylate isomerase/DsbA-like thioredoxin domain [hydrothermal vent metagenome]|uniref:2-hydroxychromene-2-carboxylate isomerase/DsbA-like thioredoxin domain n=1 Tax=hydrothermal vent metagenome TaxID=652676 RepID=A0A3B0S3L7_9ZZZZ